MKLVFESVAERDYLDDDGTALGLTVGYDGDEWVTICSYDEDGNHRISSLESQRLRVTVEVVEPWPI